MHDLGALIRKAVGRHEKPIAAVFGGRTLKSTSESGHRAGVDGHNKKKGSKVHTAVEILGTLLTFLVTPANQQQREQVRQLARDVQEVTGDNIEYVYVDQGNTGEDPPRASEDA